MLRNTCQNSVHCTGSHRRPTTEENYKTQCVRMCAKKVCQTEATIKRAKRIQREAT